MVHDGDEDDNDHAVDNNDDDDNDDVPVFLDDRIRFTSPLKV